MMRGIFQTLIVNRLRINTRMREDFAKALKRAPLERHLKGIGLNVLQDILKEAIVAQSGRGDPTGPMHPFTLVTSTILKSLNNAGRNALRRTRHSVLLGFIPFEFLNTVY